jgi:hypothetical protein
MPSYSTLLLYNAGKVRPPHTTGAVGSYFVRTGSNTIGRVYVLQSLQTLSPLRSQNMRRLDFVYFSLLSSSVDNSSLKASLIVLEIFGAGILFGAKLKTVCYQTGFRSLRFLGKQF